MPGSPFADLDAFVAVARVTDLVLSPDGSRLVAAVAAPDQGGSTYTSALWEIDPDGRREPARLTFSAKGESGPVFLPDGDLLFISRRPDPDDPDAEDSALWRLPVRGEASVLARSPGGLSAPVVAAAAPVVLLSGSRLAGAAPDIDPAAGAAWESSPDEDARRRERRRTSKASAVLHDGMPIRHWDAELGETSPRLFVLDAARSETGVGGALRDLAPQARFELQQAGVTVSADGTRILATWTRREPRGRTRTTVVSLHPAGAAPEPLLDEPEVDFDGPVLDPAGLRYAVLRWTRGAFDVPVRRLLQVHRIDGSAAPVDVTLGDVTPSEYAWAGDGSVLYVAGDLYGAGAVLAVDPADGRVRRRLAADGAYSHLRPAPDGRAVFALRSALDRPPTPVRLDTAAADQDPVYLPAPVEVGSLPGTLTRVEQRVGDVTVPGWLCRPTGPGPAPLMTWIHGGPFGSWNAWSWRWCPWVAVARGYAVLLPDPALSTGYGDGWIDRAWPHRAAVVWSDVEALTDRVLDDPVFELDRDRTCLLGASFGGYMTNWIAGHTERFRAIVTHAGLWALEQQHATTDMAAYKTGIFGRPEEHPEWYAGNSPDRSAVRIRTPMLVVHGNRDYRVPVSEALRLWWDLVSGYDGDPETMPHRFLQFTGENHWVLNPTNARTWYETVLDFCDRHAA